MEFLILVVAPLAVFLGGWVLVNSFMEETMSTKERVAVVFEVYRYAVCLLCVVFFGMMGYAVVTGMLSHADAGGIAGPGVGVLLSTSLFGLHWRLKNPSLSVD